MFDKYLKCHLAPPEGHRGSVCNDIDDLNDDESKDRIKFREQLNVIGMFGREVLGHSVPILAKILEDRTSRLCSHLQQMFSNNGPSTMKISDSTILEHIFEDIHWTILIAMHVIANDTDGEQNLIPKDVIYYSSGQNSDLEVSMKLLASPSMSISEFPNAETSADHVIRLVAAIFRLCEIERNAIDAKMGHFLSPEVSSSLLYFIKVWTDSYVWPRCQYYTDMSEALKQAFGEDTPGGIWTINFILNKIIHNVQHFTSEPTVIEDTINVFLILVKNFKR